MAQSTWTLPSGWTGDDGAYRHETPAEYYSRGYQTDVLKPRSARGSNHKPRRWQGAAIMPLRSTTICHRLDEPDGKPPVIIGPVRRVDDTAGLKPREFALIAALRAAQRREELRLAHNSAGVTVWDAKARVRIYPNLVKRGK